MDFKAHWESIYRNKLPTQVSWYQVHARRSLDLIRREDTPDTLCYCDPPYLHETRKSTEAYAFEMTEADHRELLDLLCQCEGKVMISGYPSGFTRQSHREKEPASPRI